MKKELAHFKIDKAYGGSQAWFRDPIMKIGGCAAASACDLCIDLALHHGIEQVYPFDIQHLTKETYIQFSAIMKSFLHPRIGGITKLELFVKGFEKYLMTFEQKNIRVSVLKAGKNIREAETVILDQIDKGIPVPFLLLRHKNINFRYHTWHWFLIIGYEKFEDEMYVKTATYGNYHWFSLKELMDSGYRQKGGGIILTLP
ncbi:MAG: hypothetical protein PHT89_03550 [Lachnospiraceae bacterium]|nr:hypothetical protein [Lachnospiraceae bacterium]